MKKQLAITSTGAKKSLTELRNCTKREKRKALYTAVSLHTPVSEEDDTEIGDTILVDEKEEISLLTERRMEKFINTLSNLQMKIIILLLLDFKKEDLESVLRVPKARIQDAFKNLNSEDVRGILTERLV